MPPTRRKPTTTPSTRSQKPLSFGPNPNKITKPSPLSRSKKTEKTETDITPAKPEEAEEIRTPSPAPEHAAKSAEFILSPRSLAIRNQAVSIPEVTGVGLGAVEERAAKVSEAQVKRYWKAKEEERIAPRVHQGGLGVGEKVLREFDSSCQYGVRPLNPPPIFP